VAQHEPEPPPRTETSPSRSPETTGNLNLEQRVRELELGKAAQEDAVRSIIGDSLAKVGSKINEFVTFGGALEVTAGHSTDFTGHSTDSVTLSTAELDFEIKVNEWMTGNLIFQYDTGSSILFPTTTGFNASVDRVTVDRGTITFGDVQRFPLYVKVGRDVLGYGTSTGVHDRLLSVGTLDDRGVRDETELFARLCAPTDPRPPPGLCGSTGSADGLNPLVSKFAGLIINHQF
jgi:hypothetical protein